MGLDRSELQTWYRQAMRGRIDELLALLPALESGDVEAGDAARRVGQALRGSGGTFGFARLSEMANLIETAPDADLLRRVVGLVGELGSLVGDEREARGVDWLARTAGSSPSAAAPVGGAAHISERWSSVADGVGLTDGDLAARVASYFGLEVADLSSPSRAALRLVPEALASAGRVVPVAEASTTITVATSDPTDLDVELRLERLTGRRPVFAVASPAAIEAALQRIYRDGLSRHADLPARPVPDETTTDSDLDGRKVLVVDDDASARLLVRAILEKRDYRVMEAEDGEQALDAMRGVDDVDLVVADLNMPRMDGLELIWELRDQSAWERLPVIVVTGEPDEILELQLMEEGADDYIRKPVDPRLFLARVEAAIRRSTE